MGKNSRSRVTRVVHRKTGCLRGRAQDRTAAWGTYGNIRLMKASFESRRHTQTFDNGEEFASQPPLAKSLEMDVYCARLYCSWERGNNENADGQLREFVAEGTGIGKVSRLALVRHADPFNDVRRKRLGYRTPNGVHYGPEPCCS